MAFVDPVECPSLVDHLSKKRAWAKRVHWHKKRLHPKNNCGKGFPELIDFVADEVVLGAGAFHKVHRL